MLGLKDYSVSAFSAIGLNVHVLLQTTTTGMPVDLPGGGGIVKNPVLEILRRYDTETLSSSIYRLMPGYVIFVKMAGYLSGNI